MNEDLKPSISIEQDDEDEALNLSDEELTRNIYKSRLTEPQPLYQIYMLQVRLFLFFLH